MKLHHTLVERLIKLFEVNNGFHDQQKLRNALLNFDFTIYKQGTGNEVLVSTAEMQDKLGSNPY
jgi:hypothetical protein|tara:strand:+ start:35283 stop:35474 length:192 start_codon:yes stop_codon:yes gene_type:complete